jgi:hypothetical protein
MKIDIEGHELSALRGAEGLLRKHRPVFVFESIQLAADDPGNARAVKNIVCSYGYSLHMIRGNILSPHLPDDEQIRLVSDILAIPGGKPDFVAERLSDYQMRTLSPTEQIAWLAEIALHGEPHRRHAAALIPELKRQLPDHAGDLDRLMDSLDVGGNMAV